MSDASESLESKVEAWLGKEGYRLEYLTHKAFTDAGLTSVIGDYIETTEGKPREIDVTAHETLKSDPTAVVRVMCECKYSSAQPWVLMSSDLFGNFWTDWMSLPQSQAIRAYSSIVGEYEAQCAGSWHFDKRQPFAHGLVQALRKDNHDIAYNALQKIANAAWDYVENPERKGHSVHLVTIPCLVVDAPLLFARFDYKADKFIAKSVPYGRISWTGCRGGTVVDVVHVSSLKEYAQAVKCTFGTILKVLQLLLKRSPYEVRHKQ